MLSEHDLQALSRYQWPGNVRELKNIAIRFAVDGDSSVSAILSAADPMNNSAIGRASASKLLPLSVQVASFESNVIREVLARHKGNIKLVMEELDLPRRTLNQKMIRYGLSRTDFTKG